MSHLDVMKEYRRGSRKTLKEMLIEYAGEEIAQAIMQHPSHECMTKLWDRSMGAFDWELINTLLDFCDARKEKNELQRNS